MSEVILPSKLTGTIRELTIDEENILADTRQARSGRNLRDIFKRCWVETHDSGIYEFDHEKGFDPSVLLQGDGMFLLVKLRIESYGPEFAFDVNCPMCGKKIQWEINLDDFLEANTKWLPPESAKVIKEDKGYFKRTFPRCKKDFTFRLLTIKDELKFPNIRAKSIDRLSSALVDMAIVAIDEVKDKRAFLGLDDKITEDGRITSFDANFFRQEQDAAGCGIWTDFEIECPDDGEVTIDLPFRGDFFFPKRRRIR